MDVQLRDIQSLEPFDFRWPEAIERFERGWEFVAETHEESLRVRHGLGTRIAFGRPRIRSVTWVNGAVAVEGAEADDYEASRSLVSVIKGADRKMARRLDEVPVDIRDLPIVTHRDEIRATHARSGLALKLVEDDLAGWARFAISRMSLIRKVGGPPTGAVSPPIRQQQKEQAQTPEITDVVPLEQKQAIAAALLTYAASGENYVAAGSELTADAEADALVRRDPFAFLLAVIFDQGIPYERAWAGPLELQRRLGHLDPLRIAAEPESTRAAVQQPPKLHRFIENVPAWIVLAAARVLDHYSGDAERIWGDEPTARELQRRLTEFTGIGQKKAAMAVEILERDLRVPIREMEGSDVAYDIHVRRVFLRTGFADEDSMEHMVEMARQIHPERPGALDGPAWRVGKNWCHPQVPNCPECVLRHACPRLLDRTRGLQ